MQENQPYQNFETTPQYQPVQKPVKKGIGPWLNILLFALTFITTTMAGVAWLNRDPLDISNFHLGLTYAILILTFLTFHEFGHYFAARIHKVDVTLPFYIPFPMLLNPFGTMGAVIRMRE
ncbi:MAG: hypothetical protein JNK43_01810, partial [Ignavibacteria bacterium]|nr:hypothetical protein [Ignavibacteria bacterium]